MGAYDVIERMNESGGRNAPPTVYRALDFLLKHGLIHRIESRKAFVGCATPGNAHKAQFFICRDCGIVAETHSEKIGEAIEASATGEPPSEPSICRERSRTIPAPHSRL